MNKNNSNNLKSKCISERNFTDKNLLKVGLPKIENSFSKTDPAKIEQFSDKELYQYCKFVGFNARIWSRRFIAALPEVAKRRLYKKYGYCSVHEFAAKLAGVSHNNVDAVLRVDEKLKDMLKIKSLIAEKGLNKVRLVANIAKPETENFWAEKIQSMTKSSLEIFVKEKFSPRTVDVKNVEIPQTQNQIGMFDSGTFRSQTENGSSNEVTRNKKTFTIQIDDETEFELRKFKQQLEKAKKEPVDWNWTLKEMVKRVIRSEKLTTGKADQTTKPEKVTKTAIPEQDIKTTKIIKMVRTNKEKKGLWLTRYIPAKIKHDLDKRYNGKCAYPGCNKPAEQIHHNDRFAINYSHKNIVPLCTKHHDFVHQRATNKQQLKIDNIFNKFKKESFIANNGAKI